MSFRIADIRSLWTTGCYVYLNRNAAVAATTCGYSRLWLDSCSSSNKMFDALIQPRKSFTTDRKPLNCQKSQSPRFVFWQSNFKANFIEVRLQPNNRWGEKHVPSQSATPVAAVNSSEVLCYYSALAVIRQVLLSFALLLASIAAMAATTTPTEDFNDNLDGTVTHRLTGLTWMRCSVGMTWTGETCSGVANTFTWEQALKLTATFAGKSDWRMPTIAELNTIVDIGAQGSLVPMINSTIFPK
ncbi:MAG: DUF1566 domain-containing protein, partial [Rhodoferax sp.]